MAESCGDDPGHRRGDGGEAVFVVSMVHDAGNARAAQPLGEMDRTGTSAPTAT